MTADWRRPFAKVVGGEDVEAAIADERGGSGDGV
jgi:hypothetical protein